MRYLLRSFHFHQLSSVITYTKRNCYYAPCSLHLR